MTEYENMSAVHDKGPNMQM